LIDQSIKTITADCYIKQAGFIKKPILIKSEEMNKPTIIKSSEIYSSTQLVAEEDYTKPRLIKAEYGT